MAKSHRKRHQYKVVSFKLSARQLKSLKNYCKARKTTPTKLIKKSISYYTGNFSEDVPKKYYATSNQLDIFDDNGGDKTLDMFE